MVAVKIECPCGQHYIFDVEPVNSRMPTRVACPNCGADGTLAANEILASLLPPTQPMPGIYLLQSPPVRLAPGAWSPL